MSDAPNQTLHQGQPIYSAGAKLENARAVMLMLHGRGASAQDILSMAQEFEQDAVCYLAPQAANYTWYPNRFMDSIASNEPWLSSALELIQEILQRLESSDIPLERTLLLGFSQGACLALEFCARHARRYGGIVGLSGGLIGPADTPRAYAGSFAGAPIFLGCSDVDFHIPKERVLETEKILETMGAQVTTRLYPNMGHEVNRDEIDFVKTMLEQLLA